MVEQNINVSKYKPLSVSSYIKLPKELHQSRKGLIHIQNIDENECLKWRLFRYLIPADHNPARFRKTDKDFARNLYFKDINFPTKVRHIHKIDKNTVSASVFLVMKTEKNPQFSKNTFKRHVDLLLTMFLSNILTLSCTIKHYIKHYIFAVIACNFLLLQKY